MSNSFSSITQTFVSNGTAMPTASTGTISSVTSGVLGVFGRGMAQVAAAPTITSEPSLNLFLGYADGTVKKSGSIKGYSITRYNGARYQPDTKDVWCIGYDRKAATGSIEVANDTDYTFSIGFKFDKQLYSERPLDIRLQFRSSTSATQLNIATQIASRINNHPGLKKDVVAIIVGDGNSAAAPTTTTVSGVTYTVYGGSGASNYGVEITGKDIAQFQNTSFIPRRPYFLVAADRTTGFGLTTTVTQTNAMDFGTGNYDQVYNFENLDYGTEGVVNRRLWPIPSLEYKASSTLVTAATITPTVTVVATADIATFSASVSGILSVGQTFVIGTSSEVVRIKYFISTTVAVLEAAVVTSEAAVTVAPKFGYSIITIEANDHTDIPTGVRSEATKLYRIAVPTIDASGAYNSNSALGLALKTLLDSWMASTPRSFAPITI